MKHQEVTAEQMIQLTCQFGRALSALGKCLLVAGKDVDLRHLRVQQLFSNLASKQGAHVIELTRLVLQRHDYWQR